MRKLTYALAAAATLAIAAPSIANAAGIGVYMGGDHGYYGDRYDGPGVRFYTHDRGWHQGWQHRDDYGYRDRGMMRGDQRWDR